MRRRANGTPPSDERGATAVEFALILPVFLAVMFAMIQYSIYFFSAQSGAAAAREAARRAAVGDQNCAAMTAAATNNVEMADGAVTAQRRYYASSDSSFASAVTPTVGTNVRITITYNTFDFKFPFVPFINDGAIEEVAYARVENTTPANSVACP